jgi:hypothetical protein
MCAGKVQNRQVKRKILSSVALLHDMVDTVQIGQIKPREEEIVGKLFVKELKIEGLCHRQCDLVDQLILIRRIIKV